MAFGKAETMSLPSTSTVDIETLFTQHGVPPGFNFFTGGVQAVPSAALAPNEKAAVTNMFNGGLTTLEKISPRLAAEIRPQLPLVLAFASVAKGKFQNLKPVTFPSQAGMIGANWLFPQAIKYIATPSATNPAYTSYPADSWNLSLTAGTQVDLFGQSSFTQNTPPTTTSTLTVSNYFKPSPTNGQRELILVLNNGLIEVGSTPALEQFQLLTQNENKYGPYTVEPINEITIEDNKAIYQYPTPLGAFALYHDVGTDWTAMPINTQTSTIKILGIVFYEHELFPSITYV